MGRKNNFAVTILYAVILAIALFGIALVAMLAGKLIF